MLYTNAFKRWGTVLWLICVAKIYVQRRPLANQHSFVPVQHWALYMNTYMFYCYWQHKCSIKHCFATLSIFVYLIETRSSTAYTECIVVSTSTVVMWTCHNVILCIHCLSCWVYVLVSLCGLLPIISSWHICFWALCYQNEWGGCVFECLDC